MPASHDKSFFFSETRVLHFYPPFIIVRYLCVKFITICTFSLSFFIFFTYLKKNDIPIRYRWPLRHSDNSAHFFSDDTSINQFVPRLQWNIFARRKLVAKCFYINLYTGSSQIFLFWKKKKNWAQNVFTLLCHAVKNNMKFSKSSLKHVFIPCQQIFTCSKSTLETVEKGVKYVQS